MNRPRRALCRHAVRDERNDGETERDDGRDATLQAPRRADPRQRPHEQAEIESTRVHEQAFQDVGVSP